MECDPTRVCELMMGLGDVKVLDVDSGDRWSQVQVNCLAQYCPRTRHMGILPG